MGFLAESKSNITNKTCGFCDKPCGNEWCVTKKSDLEVGVTEAFEIGKYAGSLDTLQELEELAIVDPQFLNYIKLKKKNLQEKLDLINAFKKLNGG